MTTFENTDLCATCGHLYVEHWGGYFGSWCQHINVLGRVCPCKSFMYERDQVKPIKRTYTVTVELSEETVFMLDGIQAQSCEEDDQMNITVLVSEAMALRDGARIERDRHHVQEVRELRAALAQANGKLEAVKAMAHEGLKASVHSPENECEAPVSEEAPELVTCDFPNLHAGVHARFTGGPHECVNPVRRGEIVTAEEWERRATDPSEPTTDQLTAELAEARRERDEARAAATQAIGLVEAWRPSLIEGNE